MGSTVLVVDDDISVRTLLDGFLSRRGYSMCLAANAKGMALALEKHDIDIIVLDLNLPDDDGIELTRELRTHSDLPIIMLSSRAEDVDRIIGLNMGADDYLAKPFNPHELEARIKCILRRVSPVKNLESDNQISNKEIHFDQWVLDLSARKLFTKDKQEVELTAGEFNLLVIFVEHRKRVLSRDQLLELSHEDFEDSMGRSVDVQVMRLRAKIEVNPKKPELIKTVRSAGYIFTP